MRLRTYVVAFSSALITACGGGGPATPAGLAYRVPEPRSVTYVSGDTANMDIDAGGQSMQARVMASMRVNTQFDRAEEGAVRVTMTVEDLDGRMTNPAGPPASASESDIEGAVVFTLDRQGHATVVSEPKVTQAGQGFFQPLVTANTFFPRLPGRGVGVGESWTDTISVEGAQGEGHVQATTIMTYTAVGDTMVGGRSLLRIDMKGNTDQSAGGFIAGMDYSQTVAGTVAGWVLWDMRRGLMVETYTNNDLRGSMDVSAAPFPLGIRLRQQGRIKLQEGM